MRFLSLFSGIEAASVAWLPLGWECVAVAEIEPFPCRVLAHHYPDVPNLGDITKITQEQIKSLGHIDLVVGGFPCQDLSVAGLRKGLKNADGSATRSGLFYTALQIARWSNARWLLLENVPGIYSSNNGRDFASMVGEILNTEFSVPKNGWQNSGVASSKTGILEWRTLDAQYFGVPQRRRRMFALADFGDWQSREPVLFERHSMQGHPPASREKGERVAPTVGTGAPFGRTGNDRVESDALVSVGCEFGPAGGRLTDTSPTLDTRAKDGPVRNQLAGAVLTTNRMVAFGEYSDDGTESALKARDYKDATDLVSYGIPGNWIGRKPENGGNAVEPMYDVSPCLTKADRHGVAHVSPTLTSNGDAHSGFKDEGGLVAYGVSEKPDAAHCLRSGASKADKHESTTYILQKMQVRRLTPLECHRLQGFPDHYLHQVKGATDSAMYKALGNSMAVPVMRWIGERIQMVQDIQLDRKAA